MHSMQKSYIHEIMNYRDFFKGESRSVLIKKNIVGSFLIKGWSCIIQFLLVPITLRCLNQYEYGIWLTINSILLWIDMFDIGLGNGLRNKLAEATANDDKKKSRILVSTAFSTLCLIILPVVSIIIACIYYFDCYGLLNIDENIVPDINGILSISVALVGATFIMKIIGNIYLAMQLPAISNLLVVSGQTISLIVMFFLTFLDIHSLKIVAIVYTASPLLVYIISYPITFTRYKYLRPSLSLFDKKELKGLFSISVLFFIIQVAGLVIFASSNILISKILSPSEVTVYQITYRYFSLIIMITTIIAAPVWSATTDAYIKNDWKWINGIEKKLRKVFYLSVVAIIIMLVLSSSFYKIWVGNIKIEIALSAAMAIYTLIIVYSTCYSNILYGIGKIKLIMIITLLEAIIYVPLAIYMGERLGLIGIVVALIIVNSLCAITNKIQYIKLSTNSARGIWNK